MQAWPTMDISYLDLMNLVYNKQKLWYNSFWWSQAKKKYSLQ